MSKSQSSLDNIRYEMDIRNLLCQQAPKNFWCIALNNTGRTVKFSGHNYNEEYN